MPLTPNFRSIFLHRPCTYSPTVSSRQQRDSGLHTFTYSLPGHKSDLALSGYLTTQHYSLENSPFPHGSALQPGLEVSILVHYLCRQQHSLTSCSFKESLISSCLAQWHHLPGSSSLVITELALCICAQIFKSAWEVLNTRGSGVNGQQTSFKVMCQVTYSSISPYPIDHSVQFLLTTLGSWNKSLLVTGHWDTADCHGPLPMPLVLFLGIQKQNLPVISTARPSRHTCPPSPPGPVLSLADCSAYGLEDSFLLGSGWVLSSDRETLEVIPLSKEATWKELFCWSSGSGWDAVL